MSLSEANFPINWKVVPIESVVFFQEGPGVRKHQYTDEGVKLLNGGNINNGVLNLESTDRYISVDEARSKYSHFLVDEGDLLIACSGVVVEKFDGKIAYAKKEHLPLCMNTSTMRFRALDSTVLDIDYFRRFLQTNYFKNQLQKLITGSAQLNFGPSHVKQMEIPLPPLTEQKRIAAILDKADAIRRKRQQGIQLADDFLRAVFLDMFGDPVSNPKGFPIGTIRDLVETANYGTSKKASESYGEFPILRMGNITYKGGWDFSSLKYIDLDDKEKPKYLVEKGDLLFNRTNSKELVGKTAVYEEDKPMAIAGYLIRVRTNERANNHFISGYLNSKHGKSTLVNMCKSIVGMANINAQELQDITIQIPPIALQNKYRDVVASTKEKLKVFKGAEQQQDSLFQALSQKAFSGSL